MMMTTSAFSATSLPDLQTTPPAATSSGAIGADVVQEQAVAGGLQMARHRAPHDAEADKTDIDHFRLLLVRFADQVSAVSAACQPRPSTVVVLGLYSHPTQPR